MSEQHSIPDRPDAAHGETRSFVQHQATHLRTAEKLPEDELAGVPGCARLTVQLLANRSVRGVDAVRAFFATDWHAPSTPLPGTSQAVERILRAGATHEHVTVFGDYDADGMTSCAVLVLALRACHVDAEGYIPQRDDDGRGLNVAAVEALAREHPNALIVTSDCGTSNVAETQLAQELGLDVLITDHHPPHGPVADALAVVNPQVAAGDAADAALAGVGVAFRLAEAVLRAHEAAGGISAGAREEMLTSLLDLVAVGTVGDVVPLTPRNWALARAGLERLRTAPRPGFRALFAFAGAAPADVTEREISYMLAPRLNSASRLGRPQPALDLLLAANDDEANGLAEVLDGYNRERQRLLDEMLLDARRQTAHMPDGENPGERPAVLVVIGDGWNLGLIGLVAGRLADEHGCAAFAVSCDGRECRASGRAPTGYNLVEALAAAPDLFKRFGGHARAAGCTFARDDLERFVAHLHTALAEQRSLAAGASPELRDGRSLVGDCELALERLTPDNIEAIRALAPYGAEFPEPVFVARRVRIERCWRKGFEGRNLRLRLRDGRGSRVALWQHEGGRYEELARTPPGATFDIAYQLSQDRSPQDGARIWTPRILELVPTE